jgi:hypothetical protein
MQYDGKQFSKFRLPGVRREGFGRVAGRTAARAPRLTSRFHSNETRP